MPPDLAAEVYFEDDAIPGGTGVYTSMDLLKFSVDAVPEPGAGILALGAFALCGVRYRR